MPSTLLPQGLCIGDFLCLEHSFLDIHLTLCLAASWSHQMPLPQKQLPSLTSRSRTMTPDSEFVSRALTATSCRLTSFCVWRSCECGCQEGRTLCIPLGCTPCACNGASHTAVNVNWFWVNVRWCRILKRAHALSCIFTRTKDLGKSDG